SSMGAALGLLFATWGAGLLLNDLNTTRNHVFVDTSLDARVLAFTAAVAVLTGVLIGFLPAMRSKLVSCIDAMKTRDSAARDRRSRFPAGKVIVGAQMALSLVLLIGGGLLLGTYVKLLTLDMGFDRRNVLLVTTRPPQSATSPEQRTSAYDEIG